MSRHGHADRLEIVNGPEDGMAFPLTRSPIAIGVDPGCNVQVRLDPDVQRIHARAMAVAEGYRVRRTGNQPVWVDGKRAGRVHSRIVRNGGIVRVGRTELCLQTTGEGLAARSHGLAIENDFVWAVRLIGSSTWRILRRTTAWAMRNTWGIFKWFLPILILAGIFLYRPDIYFWIWRWISWAIWSVRNLLAQIF